MKIKKYKRNKWHVAIANKKKTQKEDENKII